MVSQIKSRPNGSRSPRHAGTRVELRVHNRLLPNMAVMMRRRKPGRRLA